MYYIIYKTTNKINGKIYIGAHKTKDLDDGYLGSGKILKRAIAKYDIENFEKEILAIFDKSSDMFEMESELVNEEFIEREDTYNLKLGGEGGWDHLNDGSEEHIKRSLKANKKRAENIKNGNSNFSENYKNNCLKKYGVENVMQLDAVKEKCSKAMAIYYLTNDSPMKGKKQSSEAKRKIGEANSKHQSGSGNSQYGTIWIKNENLKLVKKIKKTEPIPEGWEKGRKLKL